MGRIVRLKMLFLPPLFFGNKGIAAGIKGLSNMYVSLLKLKYTGFSSFFLAFHTEYAEAVRIFRFALI